MGEIKDRADLVILWGANPAECHPRHFTRYSVMPKGQYTPEGRKGRTVVVVDIRTTPSARIADVFLQIRPAKDFEALTALRALIKGRRSTRSASRRRVCRWSSCKIWRTA